VATWKVKRAFDVAAAASALFIASPVLLLVALAVRLELGPGIIFRQERVGLQGRPFYLLKFRSMHPPTTAAQGPWSVSPEDLGRVGRFVRRYSLDELPQLVNVLRGDMSLVGPRPERPEYVVQFSAEIRPYTHRHRVPVGLTGLAAVNGLRGDTSIEDRAHFDNWYIDNWSLWLDIKILLRTLQALVRGTGG
jgi:lipopolysaccharide/colanic/teichoic acid biosynthesis glycosyltransferase